MDLAGLEPACEWNIDYRFKPDLSPDPHKPNFFTLTKIKTIFFIFPKKNINTLFFWQKMIIFNLLINYF
tara:strand:+ start:643 stop:849 length:207 start_codon:yes stop_codon:yes gene_type:complete